jgi:hypothetical protein
MTKFLLSALVCSLCLFLFTFYIILIQALGGTKKSVKNLFGGEY